MPIIKPKGLKGLNSIRGWNNLSDKEKQEYLNTYPSLKDKSVAEVANLYDNTQYVKEFGKEDFLAHPDKAWRDARLKHTVVDRTRNELWGDGFESLSDRENEMLKGRLDGLSDDGFLDLIDSGKFVFPTENPKFDAVAKKDKDWTEENPALSVILGKPSDVGRALYPLKGVVEMFTPNGFERNTNALDAATAKDNERKLANTAELSSQIYDMFGRMSPSTFNEEFEKVFEGQSIRTGFGDGGVDYTTPGIGIYKTFKNQHEMDNFGQEDKKKLLADYYAMVQVYGPAAAEQAVTSSLQNYISNNQTAFDWIGSAARGVGGKAIASFGQLALGIQALNNAMYRGATEGWDAADKWVANFMEGKDENGEQRPTIDNLAYWNGVDQYGVIPILDKDSATKIKEITENGGISPYSWVSEADDPFSITGATNEMLKMVGYMAAQVAIARGVGALGKGLAKGVGGAFSEVTGLYNAALSSPAANIIMKYATPGVTSALNAIPISVGYAKGSYDEVLREATDRADYEAEKWVASQYNPLEERINKGIALTKSGFAVSEDSENPQESAQIANELNNWVVQQYNNRVRQGVEPESIDVAQLYDEALSNYKDYHRNQYLNDYKESPLYQDMMEKARIEAASAYERNATIEFIRMSGVNYLFKQWQQDKSVRAAMNSNYPNLSTIDKEGKLVVTGTIFGKPVNPKLARWVQPAKTLWGGFESNYMDDVTAAYAKGFSLGRYNDYVDQLMNPDVDAPVMSWMAGFTNAMAKAEGALSDKQSWYDGFIGAGGSGIVVAPGASVWSSLTRSGRSNWATKLNYSQTQLESMARQYGLSIDEYVNGEFEKYVERVHPRYNEAQVKEEADKIRAENGFNAAVADGRIERTSVAERINRILYNPLLTQYSESAERERDYKAVIDGGNKAIAQKKDAIEDMLRAVYAVNRRDAADKTDSTLEGKEAKAVQAFTLVSMLSRWMNDPVLSQSEFVQNSWNEVQRMAKGENAITEQDIQNFYASTENRSETERPDAEEFAKQRLVSNAKQLVKMKESYDNALNRVKNSKEFRVITNHNAVDYVVEQLAFNQAMLDNRVERKTQLEKETGTTDNGNYSHIADYGNDGREEALETINKEIEALTKEKDKLSKLLEKRRERSKGESRSLYSLRRRGIALQIEEIDRQMNELHSKKAGINGADFSGILSKDEILQLNHEMQAKMFDPANSRMYSKEQRAEIENAKSELKAKDPDALEKIQDLGKLETYIKDTQKSNSIMEDNLEAAADYYEYAGMMRSRLLESSLINHHYRQVEKAIMEAKDDASKIAFAKTLSQETLTRYLEAHPEDTGLLNGVKELIKLGDDVRLALKKAVFEEQSAINARVREDGNPDTDADIAAKGEERALVGTMGSAINETLFGTTDAAGRIIEPGVFFNSTIRTEKDMMSAIEDIADRSTNPQIKALYERLLEALEDAQHARNSTVIQARRARLEAEAKQEEYLKNQDGKNFGWDGYKVGDKVWKKDGTEGTVQGFIAPANGEARGSIQVLWNGDNTITVYADDSQFSKTEPKSAIVKRATQDAINAVEACQNADSNIDKLDAVVAFEVAMKKGATVNDAAKSVIEKAKKELEEAGIDLRVYMNETKEDNPTGEQLGESLSSFTEDGGLIVPSKEQEFEEAAAQPDTSVSDVPEGSVYDEVNNRQSNKNYRADEGLLEGNGFYEYDVDTLRDLGIVERRTPEKADDVVDKWFQWLDTRQIQLQEIIDRELGTILKKYPDTKIRFMISNDPLTTNHIIQVIEYTSDIEKIHDDNLGGVITATDGKEEKRYLVVGSTYSHIGMGAYNAIGNPLKAYLKSNPKTPFYVHPTIYSKVAKMDAGRLIKRQKGETEVKYRTLGELFADSSRNPSGISFETAILGIMYDGKHMVWNTQVPANLFPPGKSEATLGRMFLAIPAANGNYIPVAIKTDMYLNSPEFRDGALKDSIIGLLRQMTSKDVNARRAAVVQLSKIIKFDSEGHEVVNGFLVGTENINNITLVLNKNKVTTWNLDDVNFDFNDFMQTVLGTSFRINVSQEMLNPDRIDTLKALDEAGVLRTDVSTLRTGNAAYQIFPVDSQGKPMDVKVKKAVPDQRKLGKSQSATSTKIAGKEYRFRQGDYYDGLSARVEDPELRKSIRYNLIIQRNGLSPIYSKNGLSYYTIVNNETNPTIVSRDKEGNIQVLSTEDAKNLLATVKEQAAIDDRRRNAEAEYRRIQEGKDGVPGEPLDDEEEEKKPAAPATPPEQPKRIVFIEPKHGNNVSYGPAIREAKVFVKHEGEVPLELHTKTVTNDDGSKTTKIVGWSQNGSEYAIPSRNPAYLEVPAEYRIPDGALPEGSELLGISEIEESTDGTLRAKAHYKQGLGYSYGWVNLERKDAPAKPKQQQPQEEKKPEKPKSDYNPNKATTKSLEELEKDRKTPTFDMLFFNREDEFYDIAEEKGWDIGDDSDSARSVIEAKLKESYPDEKIDLDAINDVDNLMKMIRNCK